MNRLDRAFQIAAAIGLFLVVLPLAYPHSTHASVVLQNFMHVPVFALVAIAALRTVRGNRYTSGWPPGTQYLIAVAVAAGMGAASEIAQIPGPRDASLADWIVDLASATTALALVHRHESRGPEAGRRRQGLAIASLAGSLFLLAPLLEATVAYGFRYQQLPDLARFHGARLDAIDTYFLSGSPVHPEFGTLPERWRKLEDPVSLKLALPPVKWPGLSLDEPHPDWRGYESLVIDLTNPGPEPLALTLRVHDAHHNQAFEDRFNTRIALQARTRETIRIPLEAIRNAPRGRAMDMAHVAGVILFRTSPVRDDQVYITRIALEEQRR